jgi:autotransporter-associated beta strand protein
LNVTGGGTLTLGATNTYTGATLINGGTLALGANSALVSPLIIVGAGTKFDVSAVSGGFGLVNLQTLSGSGVVTGAVAVASGGIINPGSNALNGILSFSNSVTETGGAINHFDLTGAPNPNNDLVIIAGDFDVSATNSVDIAGTSLVPGTNYIVIHYGGNFNGGISNFVVTTAFGALSNDPVGKTISFIPTVSQRGQTNIVWIGQPTDTNWDNEVSGDTNWLIASSGALTTFDPGDSVQFTDNGASNSPVNIVGTVSPTSILVNSHSNYVIASTSGGWIAGTTGLTVTNTGTLTILTTNTYTGSTIIDGGSALAVSQLAVNGSPGAVGESDSLVINNGTFIYSGPNVSIDRGATLGNASSAINISANGNLTLGGNLVGNGGLTLGGPGNLILSGTSSFLGVTTLSNGILQVNGTAALGANNINFDGGTLKFSGEPGQEFYANVFNVATTGTMIFNDGNSDSVIGSTGGGGGFSGTGTLNLSITNASAYCTINAHMENFAGTLHVTDDSLGNFRLNSGGGNNTAQICTGSTNATFDLGNGSVTLFNRNGGGSSGGTNYNVYDLGALAGGSNTKLSGGATASIYSIGANNSNTVFAGTIQNTSSSSTVGITKVGTGTLTLLGESTYTGPTIVSNGVLALSYNPTNSNDGEIFGTPTITIAAGAVIDVSGEAADPGTLQLAYSSSQILQGNGTVNGTLDASSSSSTISPGGGISGSIGKLTVSHAINEGGTEWMKINRSASPNSDQLVSSTGNIYYLGGTFVVTNIGPRLQAGDTFKLFSGVGTGGGSLGTIILPGYYTWDTSQLIANGTITVTAVLPLPSVTKADFSGLAGGAITLNTTNGIAGTSVNVLSSTNLALPFSSWKTVTNTTFNANGNLADPNTGNPGLTIYVNPTNSPSFYLLQTLGF